MGCWWAGRKLFFMKRKIFLFLAIVSAVGMITISGCGKERVYTVTFDANGGIGEMKQQTFVKDVSQALISNAFTLNGYAFTGWNTISDGIGVAYSEAEEIVLTDDITLYAQWKATLGQKNGHEYIDLGLPSGTLWATCNIGANVPEEYGDYFAWGEITSKEVYEQKNYKYYDTVSQTYTKYTETDGLVTLTPNDDAATANWGAEWRMPTYEESVELLRFCDVKIFEINGVNGFLLIGPNGCSIFFPTTGWFDTKIEEEDSFSCWLCSVLKSNSSYIVIKGNTIHSIYYYLSRYKGLTIRAVVA